MASLIGDHGQAVELIATLSVVATQAPELQDQFVRRFVEAIQPSNEVGEFLTQAAQTMKEPPPTHLRTALTLAPSHQELTRNLPLHDPIVDPISHDLTQILHTHARIVAGAFVHNAALHHDDKADFIQSTARTIQQRNEVILTVANVAAAVCRMTSWDRPYATLLEAIEEEAKVEAAIQAANILNQPAIVRQTPRQFITKIIHHIMARRLQNLIGVTQSTPSHDLSRPIRFWQEVIQNLPART